MLLLIYFVLAFATVCVLLWSGIELFREQEDPLGDRLVELQAHAMVSGAQAPKRRGGGGVLNNILYVISLVPGGEDWLFDTEEELAQAGIRKRQALAVYSICNILFFVLLLGGALWLVRGSDFFPKVSGIVAALMLGMLLPQQVLHRLVKSYRQKLQEALPDTVDLLGIVLGTGLALDQAMLRVSEEMDYIYPELASEFATVVMQVKAGQERAKAFEQLTKRTGIEDLKSLAAMIIQSERFGTSLSQSLKVYADSLRNRRRLRAETATAKAGVKMIFPVVLFILPALLVVVFGPVLLSAMQMFRQGFGPR